MKLVEMLSYTAQHPSPVPAMGEYTHQDEVLVDAIHQAMFGAQSMSPEQVFLAGMAAVVIAIKQAGELPDDLAEIPIVPGTENLGSEQEGHDATASRLLSTLPCPDCGAAEHPGSCDEPSENNPQVGGVG